MLGGLFYTHTYTQKIAVIIFFWNFGIVSLHSSSVSISLQNVLGLTLVLCIVFTEAVAQRCSVNKVFLETSQNSQKNTCARVSFLIKLQASVSKFIKKETLAARFLRTPFFKEYFRWLLLCINLLLTFSWLHSERFENTLCTKRFLQ